MLKQAVHVAGDRRIVIMDSITKVTPEDAGCFVVAASHGGASSGEFALEVPLGLVVLNDAGIGKDQAGIASLRMLEARGVAGATVSHDSARIGDSRDMWESGVISRVNAPALALGLAEGQKLQEVLPRLLEG
jgi:hypothetical protein